MMTESELQKIFSFITYIEELKKILRYKDQFYWKDYPGLKRYESVADHTWRLAIMILILSNFIEKKVNVEKAIKMALVHDIPEIMAGDKSPMGKDGTGKSTHAFNKDKEKQKRANEEKAARKIFGKLPKPIADELYNLWNEHEDDKTLEAKVVKSLDKIEAMFQVYEYQKGYMFKKHLNFTTKYGLKNSDVDPAVKSLGGAIAKKLRSEFREFKKQKT